MSEVIESSPNVVNDAATTSPQPATPDLESQLIAALAARPGRNPAARGVAATAGASEAATPTEEPVAPESMPEADASSQETVATEDTTAETAAPDSEPVSTEDAINFLDFARDNPQAKIRIPNKNTELGYVELSAEKAAAILGQGSAIHEEQRKFKAHEAEFKEYEARRRQEIDALGVALEFTVAPQLQKAYEEIRKTQQYNNQFQQMLADTTDVAQQLKIQANIEQNDRYIQQQAELIQTNKPKLDYFMQQRTDQVKSVVENSRKSFQDKELRNEYTFNELRDRLKTGWSAAEQEFIPGVKNIDLVSSDEHILSLLRDGLKYRQGPKQISNAGNSIAAATHNQRRSTATISTGRNAELQERAAKGDKTASRDLLSAYLSQQRAQRKA